MNEIIEKLKPRPDDLVVVPEHYDVPTGLDFLVCKVKYLLSPSIIRSGGGVAMLESIVESTKKFPLKSITEMIFGKKDAPIEAVASTGGLLALVKKDDVKRTENPPMFLRHVRLCDPDSALSISSKGGMSVLVQLLPAEDSFRFSYSICSPKDLFNKRAARGICMSRINHEDYFEVSGHDHTKSIVENIEIAVNKYLTCDFIETTIKSPKFSKVSIRVNDQELKKISHIIKNSY